jgi:hypothetical protein
VPTRPRTASDHVVEHWLQIVLIVARDRSIVDVQKELEARDDQLPFSLDRREAFPNGVRKEMRRICKPLPDTLSAEQHLVRVVGTENDEVRRVVVERAYIGSKGVM